MKKGILIWILICVAATGHADLLRWDGEGGDGQWNTALNWLGDHLPGPADEVLLDNSLVAGSYTVFLPEGAVAVSVWSLTITPAGVNTIICALPAGNTASPAFTAVAEGDALILNRGAVFRNSSGAGSGTPVTVSPTGWLRINNGGRYIHQTQRGHTDHLVSRLSQEPGTEQGIFEFDVPGTAAYTVSVSNRVFGKLVFSAASSGSLRTYTGAGINPVSVRGDLEIHSNAVFSYGANTDTIQIQGACTIEAGATLNVSNGSNSAVINISGALINKGLITETGSSDASAVVLNGSSLQPVTCTGSISQQVRVVINNSSGLVLLTPLAISHKLEFVRGKIFTSTGNPLLLGTAALCSGASATGFVEGPVKKTGSAAFDFPVGKGAIYAPISIGAGGSDADEFMAEYKRANPQSTPGLGSGYESPIHHISYVEYWNLSRVVGNSPRRVKLSVSPYSFAYTLDALVVARAENGEWKNEGGDNFIAGDAAPPYITGTFISSSEISAFGAFTLGSIIDQTQNPLPLLLRSFKATLADAHTVLRWQTGICPASSLRFDIERSGPGQPFSKLATVAGNAALCDYSFRDPFPQSGDNFYRLKIISDSGQLSISKTVVVFNPVRAFSMLQIPTMVRHELPVRITEGLRGELHLLILDIAGRVVASHHRRSYAAGATILLPVQTLSRGAYWLAGSVGEKRINAQYFLKQ